MKKEPRILNWAILITGWGNGALNTLKEFVQGNLEKNVIKVLVYENDQSGAVEFAKENNIETLKICRNDFKTTISYQKNLIIHLQQRKIDFIFLMAYKYIIKEEMLNAFPSKIINIHPSLFPSFLGTKTAIQDAIEYGVKITGITTHIIDNKIDRGVIICQEPIKIKKKDTFETLYPKFSAKGRRLVVKTIKKIYKKYYNV